MLTYGLACLLVCILSLADRRALPWALTISAGWLAGFAGADYWPLISFGVVSVTLLLFLRDRLWWGAAVHVLAVMMLALDLWYFANLSLGRYVGVEYSRALNIGLAAQLLLIGHRGGLNVWSSLRRWSFGSLFRVLRHGVVSASERKEAP